MPLKMIDHDLRAQCLETLYTATESLEFIAAALDEEDAVARGEHHVLTGVVRSLNELLATIHDLPEAKGDLAA